MDIDVVITTLPDSNREWFSRCLNSLKDEPVNLYFVNGKRGQIGYGRAESLRCGSLPYIAFVDPDDEVEPGIFEKIIPLLSDYPVHVYTDEILIDEDGNKICDGWSIDRDILNKVPKDLIPLLWDKQNKSYFHHLNVFSRDEALLYLQKLYVGHRGIEGFLFQHIGKFGIVKHLSEIGYRWRMHKHNISNHF